MFVQLYRKAGRWRPKDTKMITIDFKLFVSLTPYLPPNANAYPVPEGQSIAWLIAHLGLPEDLVKLIFVNGRRAERSYLLQDGDRVGIFPPVGGG